VVLVDMAVARKQGSWLRALLATAAGRPSLPVLTLPGGEQVKSLTWLERAYDWLASRQLPREGLVVAVGGGALLDLAGFAAATWHRGIRWSSVPTTLLAMVDASLGGKTAINTADLKNPVGAFHPADSSYADPAVLSSLPRLHWRAGLAEMIKAAVVGSRPLFRDLRRHQLTLSQRLGHGRSTSKVDGILAALPWPEWIVQAARVKVRIVTTDFRETGPRQALNLGHTLGHALEAHLGCSHGEAVAVGMATAVRVAVTRGLCPPDEGWQIIELLKAVGLPVTADPPPLSVLTRLLKGDKKHTARQPAWVLPERIGKVHLDQRVEPAEAATACRG
jgi:3-dehydroquinate synthase